jgi:hypothetical protein
MDEQVLEQLLTEDELRTEMSRINRGYIEERNRLKDAFKGLARKKALAHRAAKLLIPELLTDPDAQMFLQALTVGKPPSESDKEAIVILETSKDQEAYDEAKFDCDTSDKYFAQLDRQVSYYQSLMKHTGPTERQ